VALIWVQAVVDFTSPLAGEWASGEIDEIDDTYANPLITAGYLIPYVGPLPPSDGAHISGYYVRVGDRLDLVESTLDGLGDAATKNVGTAAGTVAAGDAVVRLTGDQTVAGVKTLSSHPLVSAGGSAGSGSRKVASEQYVTSRTDNLFTNCSGLLGNNYNMSYFVFDESETHGGAGSFKITTYNGSVTNDELIPVDPTRYYYISAWAKSGNADGSEYAAGAQHYLGVTPHDADQLAIGSNMYQRQAGATDTTLDVQLNPGDWTMTLANATGWYNGATAFSRHFAWWPYVNAIGYSHAPYTYSRNTSESAGYAPAVGAWNAGGISGNTVTLSRAWAGPTLAAGTPVANFIFGATYKYCTSMNNSNVPNVWTKYSGYIGSLDTAGTNLPNLFPYGTSYMVLQFLVNRTVAGNAIRFSDIYVGTTGTRNLATATATVPGVVTAPATSVPGLVAVPASKTAAGVTGQQAADANHAYFCVATNTWIRVAKDGTW
jgi:hypothetical protein